MDPAERGARPLANRGRISDGGDHGMPGLGQTDGDHLAEKASRAQDQYPHRRTLPMFVLP
jgi:hypothetical protein